MKFRLLLLFTLLFAACVPESPPNGPPAEETPIPTETSTLDAVEPDAPASTTTPTSTATPPELPELVCTTLLSPENGIEIPYRGPIITFSFSPVEGVEIYHLNILTPVGKLITFELDSTSADRIISTFTMPGGNSWYVEALNENREVVCTSEVFSFVAVDEQPTCTKLISPENGSNVPAVGKVTFAWEPVVDADSYLLNFTLPNGTIVTFETDETTKDRYMEAFGISGEFEWNVAALDVNGNEICISETVLFKKPATSNQNNGDVGDSSGDDGKPPISPGN